MSSNRKQTRLARARQAETGESYTAALRWVREHPASHPVSPRSEPSSFDELLADADQPSVAELEQAEREDR